MLDIEAEALKTGKKDYFMDIGNNHFKFSMIKGIIEIKEEVKDYKEQWLRQNQEWNTACSLMSKKSPEDKTTTEIDNRILNILNHDPSSLPTDPEMAVIYANVLQFFKDNPLYPRCPRYVWWPYIRDKVKNSRKLGAEGSLFLGWWRIVDRNDNAIAEWLKFQEGKT